LAAILLLACALRLHDLGRQSLWTDEAFSFHGAVASVGDAFQFLLGDSVHPPLYYFIQRLALVFGTTEFALRYPAAMYGLVSVAVVARLGRIWVGRWAALMAALFVAFSPFAIWYSHEARMYSLLMLLGLGVMDYFQRLLFRRFSRADFFFFTLLSAGAYLSHYFGLYLPLIQFVYLVLTFRFNFRHLRTWFLVQLLAIVPIALWLVALYSTGAFFGISWIQPPQWLDPFLTLQNFVTGYGSDAWRWGAALAMLALIILGAIGTYRRTPMSLVLILWAGLPLLVTLLMSLRRPTYVDRFLIGSLPPLMVLAAVGLGMVWRRNYWGGAILAASLTVAMLASSWGLFDASSYPKEDWRGLAQTIAAHQKPDDKIVLRFLYYYLPFAYYYQAGVVPQAADRETPAPLLAGRVWLVYRGRMEDSHKFATNTPTDLQLAEQDEDILSWLEEAKPYQIDQQKFAGLTLYLYDFTNRQP
jgi:uncharacterized membrane protein